MGMLVKGRDRRPAAVNTKTSENDRSKADRPEDASIYRISVVNRLWTAWGMGDALYCRSRLSPATKVGRPDSRSQLSIVRKPEVAHRKLVSYSTTRVRRKAPTKEDATIDLFLVDCRPEQCELESGMTHTGSSRGVR